MKVVKLTTLAVLISLSGLIFTPFAYARVCDSDKPGLFEICLDVHQDIIMGTIDEDIYTGATPEGDGSFTYLEKRKNIVSVKSKAPGWYRKGVLNWTLQVEIVSVSPSGLDTNDLKLKRSNQANYEPLPILGKSSGNKSFAIDYRYDVDIDDAPGVYVITLRYTATAFTPRKILRVSETVNLTWLANTWAILAVHSETNLGTISESTYIGATPRGGGSFSPLEASGNNIFVITNAPQGWKLKVEAIDWVTPADYQSSGQGLGDLYWRGEKQINYKTIGSLNTRSIIDDSSNTRGSNVYKVDYKYDVEVNDIEGSYAITLRYILSTLNGAVRIAKVTGLIWRAESWIVLAVHDSVNLGAIDQSLVQVDAKGNVSFKNLKMIDNPLFVISNASRGWSLDVKVADTTAPSGFSGDLLQDFSWHWRRENEKEKYRSGKKLAVVAINMDKASGPASRIYTMDYEYNVDVDDIEGNYSITLVYSVCFN